MNLKRLIGCVAVLLLTSAPSFAQRAGCMDDEPTGSVLRIAPASEPGERLVVNGRVTAGNGTPLAGLRVRVYHTDDAGYYSVDGMDEENARLCGVLATAEDGSYRIETILPGAYATGGPPPHLHLQITRPNGSSRLFTLFWNDGDGDPAAGDRGANRRPLVRGDDGGLRLVYDPTFGR